ncbi:MAG: hypothetical protein K2N94_15135, partial [Lachnospiraceae bacterium]|nr:hypothetical protein [Lachnospiraceae bacterium]
MEKLHRIRKSGEKSRPENHRTEESPKKARLTAGQSRGELPLRVLLYLLAAVFCLPVIYVILSSLSFQGAFGPGQYRELIRNYPSYFRALKNSLFYAVLITAGGMLLSVPTAYLFARVRFRGRNSLFFVYIVIMMLPAQSTILGQYLLLQSLGWIDERQAAYLPLML